MTNVRLAIVENSQVTNIMVGKESQIGEFVKALGKEIVYEPRFNLQIGDLRVGGKWTRNVGGIQTELNENYTYDELNAIVTEETPRIDSLETQMTDAQVALVESYESSETQITDLQLAITELYELLLSTTEPTVAE